MPVNFSDKSAWNVQYSGGINNTNVATLGEINVIMNALGVSIAYGSQGDLGKRFCFTESEIATYTNSTVGTLYGGMYVPVQVDTGATGANIYVGAAAYILDTATGGATGSGAQGYVVTDSAHAISTGLFAGVFLNAITPGNYGFICVAGKVNVKYTATVTSTSLASSVVTGGATAGSFDAIVAAITGITLPTYVGEPIVAPANAGLSAVQLRGVHPRF